MSAILKARHVLDEAETQIRDILVSAAGAGDYETVSKLAQLARELRSLAEQLRSSGAAVPRTLETEKNDPDSDKPIPSAAVPSPFYGAHNNGTSSQHLKIKGQVYPRFYRSGDDLVKIGWSKKQRAEYRHKAPKSVVQRIAEIIAQKGSGSQRVVFEDILPNPDPVTGAEVPMYQAYLAVAWLRHEKLIVKHGRQGYSLPPHVKLPEAIEERWTLLASL
jgi:hypothetical protein